MPKGPRGEKRPADAVGCALHVAKIATGEIEDTRLSHPAKRKGELAGAKARAAKLTARERNAFAAKAAAGRWES